MHQDRMEEEIPFQFDLNDSIEYTGKLQQSEILW